MFANLLRSMGGILVCGYILLLASRDQLGFYTHPRYHLFAVIISIAGVALFLIDIMLQFKNRQSLNGSVFNLRRVKVSSYLAIIILTIGYTLPPKTLSPSSLAQRENPAIIEAESRCEIPKPTENSSTISINRWKTAMNSCNYGYDYFYIARYVISCCAVDSVPVKIVVEKSFSVDYPDGTWVIVKGKLSQKVINGQAEYVITQPNTTKISQPKYPYELMGI